MIFCVFNMCCCTVLQGIGRKELWIICWQWWWGLAQRKQWADWQCKDEIKKKAITIVIFSFILPSYMKILLLTIDFHLYISKSLYSSYLPVLFYSPTIPSLHVSFLVSVVVVAVQVGNMNYLAGRRCSAWKTAVSMVRMDEERQERDETDSSSQPSSTHPLPLLPRFLFCMLLPRLP